jgi:hypothetical protein
VWRSHIAPFERNQFDPFNFPAGTNTETTERHSGGNVIKRVFFRHQRVLGQFFSQVERFALSWSNQQMFD